MQKLIKLLFCLTIVFLPSQLALHFWPDYALIFGIRVDYLSPTIYFTDLLILPLLRFDKKILWILPLVIINIVFSIQPEISFFRWLKVFEMIGFGGFIYYNLAWVKKVLPTFFSISLIYSFLIALLQFTLGRHIGGVLYWLGERDFAFGNPGIPNFPPATFPHPNVLGAFGLVGFLITKSKISKLSALGIILFSYSQAVWAAAIASRLIISRKVVKLMLVVSIFGSIGTMFLASKGFDNYAVSSRIALAQSAGVIVSSQSLLGVGLGNFVLANQPNALEILPIVDTRLRFQPVHNIFLLLLAEIGILGLLVVVFLILIYINRANRFGLTAVVIIMLTGVFDHYWLTLHQANLLLVILLSLGFAKMKHNAN